MDDTRAGAEQALLRVFDDLEQQAAGLHLLERDLEVADVSVAEYATVDLESRLRASVGAGVSARLSGGWHVEGRLLRVGAGWWVLGDGGGDGSGASGGGRSLVGTDAVTSIAGMDQRAAHPVTRSVADALPLRAVLRRLGEESVSGECQLLLVDGRRLEGRQGRVGRDFVELRAGAGQLVPLRAVAAVRWPA